MLVSATALALEIPLYGCFIQAGVEICWAWV